MNEKRPATHPKRPYRSPRLIDYGSVAVLTQQNAKALTSDKGGNGMRS
jgi:hypothetical protein